MTRKAKIVAVVMILALAVAAMLLGAASCDKAPQIPSDNPQPCTTTQGLDGRWYDEDGEVVDEDPCDGVDLDAYHVKSPKPKPVPVKTPQRPAPRRTR